MELHPSTKQYWTDEDFTYIESIETLKEMYVLAERILSRMPDPIIEVCGPISTGGRGSVEANLEAFRATICALQDDGKHVFDQTPFEVGFKRVTRNLEPGEYMEAILTDFYQPIFESGRISTFYFMPDWQSSKGARWEHEQAKRLGIEIFYL